MNKNLHYITFQNFPMFSANTIVTMKNLSYLNKRGYDVTLVFPGLVFALFFVLVEQEEVA